MDENTAVKSTYARQRQEQNSCISKRMQIVTGVSIISKQKRRSVCMHEVQTTRHSSDKIKKKVQ